MTTQYTNWKQQQGPSIFRHVWQPHAAVIMMMILDRVKEKHMRAYIRDELGLKHPKKVLRECRLWAGAPDPHMFMVARKKRKIEVLDQLTKVWQSECNVPYCERALLTWFPEKLIEFPYNEITENEAKIELDRLKSIESRKSGDDYAQEFEDSVEDAIVKQRLEKSGLKEKIDILNSFLADSSSGYSEAVENDPSKVDQQAQQKPILSNPQQMAIKELSDAYAVSLRARDLDASISPRTNCLMVGPSGSGKTFLARSFAEKQGVPFMSVNVSSWTLIASRVDPENYTLVQIAAFIESNPNGIIYLDELDKIDGPDAWNSHLRLEIHNLLDGQVGVEVLDGLEKRLTDPVSSETLEAINQSLKDNFFIVAGGTWQEFWENRTVSSVGFNSSEETRTLDKGELTKHITAELLQRFQQARILLKPLSIEDVLALAEQIGEQLKKCKEASVDGKTTIHKAFLQAVAEGVEEAVKNKIGMRFLEECVTHALKPSVAVTDPNDRVGSDLSN